MKSALMVDIGHLYHTISNKYPNKYLDYKKLLTKANDFGKVERAIAYGTQSGHEAGPFIACLRNFGYDVRYKRHQLQPDSKVIIRKALWDVGIAVDMIRLSTRYDNLVLASADTDLIPAIQYIREHGMRVVCMSFTIPQEIRENVDYYFEISEDLLQEKSTNVTTNVTEQVVVSP